MEDILSILDVLSDLFPEPVALNYVVDKCEKEPSS